MSSLLASFTEVRERIAAACETAGRDPSSVQLVAVSKTFPACDIRQAVEECGQACFGESRLQEAEPKIAELPENLDWHFIGRVQRNKVRKILPLFSCIHGVDSLRLAAYADGVAGDLGCERDVFLQIDLAGEQSKGGFSPEEFEQAVPELVKLRHLRVIGLMAIPPAADHPEESRRWFRQLRKLRDAWASSFSTGLPSLSMGMSGDFETAIEEGATHVRVGSLLFGKRAYRVEGELG